MELDQLLTLLSTVSWKLLPIVGVVAIIYLIIFLKKLISAVLQGEEAIHSMNETLKTANRQLEALDKPMETIQEISETIDHVHEASKHMTRTAFGIFMDNIGDIIRAVKGAEKDHEAVIEKETERSEQNDSHEGA